MQSFGKWFLRVALMLSVILIIDWNLGYRASASLSTSRFWWTQLILLGLFTILLTGMILQRKRK
jgi:hypothetical protein